MTSSSFTSLNKDATDLYGIKEMVPGFLQWIDVCNNGVTALAENKEFTPFVLDSSSDNKLGKRPVGYISQRFRDQILKYPDVFVEKKYVGSYDDQYNSYIEKNCETEHAGQTFVTLTPKLMGSDLRVRSAAVAEVMHELRAKGVIKGWRDEEYPVMESFYEEPVLLLERAAAPFFGIKAYGVHINGYVVHPGGKKELWVARRSSNKPTWPGKLDHIVAGGQPHGISLAENVVKECHEEAGIPGELARKAVPVGVVSYTSLQESGLKRDVLFCYDIELPLDFIPVPQDGEVEEFFKLSLEEVAALVADHQRDPYKDNCNLVVLDFLIRHGVLTPDIPGYLDIISGLRKGDCS